MRDYRLRRARVLARREDASGLLSYENTCIEQGYRLREQTDRGDAIPPCAGSIGGLGALDVFLLNPGH
jgi:hypothetical protein